jgi:cytidylate kinase
VLIITISRQTGSLGEELARELSKTFGLPLVDRELVQTQWLSRIASSNHLKVLKESPKAHLTLSSEGIPFYVSIENRLKDITKGMGAIILGLGAQVIFQNYPNAFHVRVVSPEPNRISRVCEQYGVDAIQAQKFISLSDRKRRKYLYDIYSQNWEDNRLYHITLNTGKLMIKDAVQIISGTFPDEIKKDYASMRFDVDENRNRKRKLVHQSEVDFVKVLDMYHVEWKYEPTTFPIEWDAEGNVTMAFTPDFFLPAYQTYIELTTMNQRYVTEKNKKLRKLRSLYPEINITILYKKDIIKLLKKFGVIKEA